MWYYWFHTSDKWNNLNKNIRFKTQANLLNLSCLYSFSKRIMSSIWFFSSPLFWKCRENNSLGFEKKRNSRILLSFFSAAFIWLEHIHWILMKLNQYYKDLESCHFCCKFARKWDLSRFTKCKSIASIFFRWRIISTVFLSHQNSPRMPNHMSLVHFKQFCF